MIILIIKKLNKILKKQFYITYKMNLGIIVLLILVSMVYSLRPFQRCNGCIFNNNCNSSAKGIFITNNDIWKDYENDPNPPVDIDKINNKLKKLNVDDDKFISELDDNYEILKIFKKNMR